MKNETTFRSYFYLSLVVALASLAYGQVPVAIAPSPHPQFLTSSGLPLSGGFIYTYIAGTTTLSNTYADSTGTVQNPDPIPLDVSGAPSNGTAQTGIWLSNQAFKFCAFNSSMVQQWCTDNVTSYFQLLNFANTWTFPQTFTGTITDTLTDNQIILGALGVQTTLDFPPPAGPVTLHFPNTADTMIGRATTDTLSHKTFSDIPPMGGGTPVVAIYKPTTPITHTGDLADDVVYSVPLPALSINETVRLTVSWKTNVQGVATTHVYVGWPGTTNITGSIDVTSGASGYRWVIDITNQGSVTTQNISYAAFSGSVLGATSYSGAFVNTGSPTTLNVRVANGSASDSQTFNEFLVEVF